MQDVPQRSANHLTLSSHVMPWSGQMTEFRFPFYLWIVIFPFFEPLFLSVIFSLEGSQLLIPSGIWNFMTGRKSSRSRKTEYPDNSQEKVICIEIRNSKKKQVCFQGQISNLLKATSYVFYTKIRYFPKHLKDQKIEEFF